MKTDIEKKSCFVVFVIQWGILAHDHAIKIRVTSFGINTITKRQLAWSQKFIHTEYPFYGYNVGEVTKILKGFPTSRLKGNSRWV